jgi:hypothetical protein
MNFICAYLLHVVYSFQVFWLKFCIRFQFSPACYMPIPCHPPWLYHPNNIWWRVRFIKFLTGLTSVPNMHTERRGRVVNTADSYSDYRPTQIWDRRPVILTQLFVVFLSPSRQILRHYLKIRPLSLPSIPFPILHQLISHLSDGI